MNSIVKHIGPANVILLKILPVIEWIISLLVEGHPLSAGFSAGKGSSVVLVAIKRCVYNGISIHTAYIIHANLPCRYTIHSSLRFPPPKILVEYSGERIMAIGLHLNSKFRRDRDALLLVAVG